MMTRLLVLFLLCAAMPAASAEGVSGDSPNIRVAISRGSPSLRLGTSARIYVLEVKSGQKFMLLANSAYSISASGDTISVAGQELTSPIKLLASEGQRIHLGNNFYKGDILIKSAGDGKVDIIEYLPLEDYLYGVLPVEMSPDWPLEALKAQAVASRTYALKNMSPGKDYDITDGAEMQVYNGTAKINSRIRDAVDSTKGLVLKYKGKLITAFFHACCGGHTISVSSAWGEDIIKPLSGVRDPYCSTSPHYRWEIYIPAGDLLRFIQSQGSTALKLKAVRVSQKDKFGRSVSLKFATDRGSVTAPLTLVRKFFGNSEFRSTYITGITPAKGGFEFYGRGWGHGVGMCQEGAKFMAMKGRPYKKILHQYYPGAAIMDYD